MRKEKMISGQNLVLILIKALILLERLPIAGELMQLIKIAHILETKTF